MVAWVVAALRQWQKKGHWTFQGFYHFFRTVNGGSRGYEAEQIRRKLPPDLQPGDLKELEGKWGFPRNFRVFFFF